jgi:hypothetical protein
MFSLEEAKGEKGGGGKVGRKEVLDVKRVREGRILESRLACPVSFPPSLSPSLPPSLPTWPSLRRRFSSRTKTDP